MQVIAVAMFVKNPPTEGLLSRLLLEPRSGVGSGVNVINGAIVGTYVSVLVLLSVLASVGSIVTYIIIVVANRPSPIRRVIAPAPSTTWEPRSLLCGWRSRGHHDLRHAVQPHRRRKHNLRFVRSSPTRGFDHPGITIGLLLSIVGGYTALTHRSKAIELAGSEEAEASPSMRVVRSYAAVVSFISVIVVVIASLAFVWALLGLIAPGVYQAGARTEDIRVLLDEATVLAVFAWVFSTHRRLVGVR